MEPDRTSGTRRALLKKAGVGAGVVWAAPVWQSLTSPAYASAGSDCTCDPLAWTATHAAWRPVGPGVYIPLFQLTGTFNCPASNRVHIGTDPGTITSLVTSVFNGAEPVPLSYTVADYPVTAPMSLVKNPGATLICECGTINIALDLSNYPDPN